MQLAIAVVTLLPYTIGTAPDKCRTTVAVPLALAVV
jgi:hypothetical protein